MKLEVENLLERGEFHEVARKLDTPKDDWDHYYLAVALTRIGKYSKARKALKFLNDEMSDKFLYYRSFLLHQYIKYRTGNYHLIEPLEKEIQKLSLEHMNYRTELIAEYYDLLGLVFSRLGETDLAHQYIRQAVELADNHYRQDVKGMLYNDLGIMQIYSGNYIDGEQYLIFAKEIFEDLNHKHFLGFSIGNLGKLYRMLGENYKSLEFATKSMKIKEEFGNLHDLSMELMNIGILHQCLREYDKAIFNFSRCLELREDIGNEEEISQILYYIILLQTEQKNCQLAQNTYERHSHLSENTPHRSILQRDKIIRATLWKCNDNLADTFSAKQLFADIIEEPVIQLDHTIYCLFQMIDILLMEYKVQENQESLNQIIHYLNVINDIARQQKIFSLIVEILMLQSRLSLIQFDIEKTQLLITQSEFIIEEKNLQSLMPKVVEKQKELTELFLKWKEIVDSSTPLSQRIEHSDVVNYLDHISKVVNY